MLVGWCRTSTAEPEGPDQVAVDELGKGGNGSPRDEERGLVWRLDTGGESRVRRMPSKGHGVVATANTGTDLPELSETSSIKPKGRGSGGHSLKDPCSQE